MPLQAMDRKLSLDTDHMDIVTLKNDAQYMLCAFGAAVKDLGHEVVIHQTQHFDIGKVTLVLVQF